MRVLLIDDSATLRRIEAGHLADLGHTDVLQANDGAEGLELLEKNMPVDAILLDINMPKMDGMTALRAIRSLEKYRGVRIIMVTSESEKSKVLEAIRAGADDYLVKPFQPEEFKKRMEGLK